MLRDAMNVKLPRGIHVGTVLITSTILLVIFLDPTVWNPG